SDALAEKAVSLVFRNLPRAVEDGMDLDARTAMLNASCMAGIAFNHAKLGLCHGMAHALGAHFHVSHGRANSVFLPAVISFNGGIDRAIAISGIPVRKKYAVISRMLGFGGENERELTARLVDAIVELRRQTGLPAGARDLNIPKDEYESALEQLTDRAFHDTCTATNPVTPHLQQVKKLFIESY
ncbi:MAG: iron-containing alcohol dehydrogenase, partial [Bacillota bacterium]|nr:iron-containing alcohol dehydrogenase [Bacillota bacterium]